MGAPLADRHRALGGVAVILGLAVVLTVLRSAVLVVCESAMFDSDQALIGLMALHLIEGRAFPVFTYGQPYMLGLEAWMAAPFFLVGGPTVAMLKAPLLVVNAAVAALLVRLLQRAAGLSPGVALLPALFFVLAPPGTTALLLEASGGNVEPFLYVLLLWVLRARPLGFGALLALGVLHREFTVYAFGALVIIRVFDGGLWSRAGARAALLGGISCAAVWQTVYVLKQFSSIEGPGTSARWGTAGASANVEALMNHFCFDPATVGTALGTLLFTHVPEMFGVVERPLRPYGINSTVDQGADWLWPVFGIALVAGLVRVLWLLRDREARTDPHLQFAAYLGLVGIQALAVYGLFRCGVISIGTLRYSLLGVFGVVGLSAAFFRLEVHRWARAVAAGVIVLWAAVSASAHVRLGAEYLTSPPPDARRELANYLVEHDIRFARGDYWDAYGVVFMTGERTIVASTNVWFIREYQWIVEEQADRAMSIRREPCGGDVVFQGWLYLCPPGR